MAEENRIRSALEIALEKADKIKVSDQELENVELVTEGKRLAARYLKEDKFDLKSQLAAQPKPKHKFLVEGIVSVFLQNIILPQNERQKTELRKVLEGLVIAKENKGQVSQVCAQLEQIFDQYTKVKDQNYKMLKQKFESELESRREEIEQQMGPGVKINVERHPEFLKTWQQMSGQINTEFEAAVDEMKQHLKSAKQT